ncbi:manganese and iron superoxide dismutase, partial [Halorubrum saccharovorum DSM 1137]
HQGYVNGWNSAEETLEENREAGDFSSSGGAMRNVTHNSSGHILHDLFWQNMSPEGGDEPSGALADRIEEDFGSYEAWKGEFEAAASAAGGWALLVYDTFSNQLRNVVVDKHDQGAIWGGHPGPRRVRRQLLRGRRLGRARDPLRAGRRAVRVSAFERTRYARRDPHFFVTC